MEQIPTTETYQVPKWKSYITVLPVILYFHDKTTMWHSLQNNLCNKGKYKN